MNRITQLADQSTAINMLMSACIYLDRQMEGARLAWDLDGEIALGRAIEIIRHAEARVCHSHAQFLR